MPLADKDTLGRNVKPTNYKLLIKPDLKNFTFEGSASISVRVDKAAREIWLNSSELEIKSCAVRAGGSSVNADARPAGDGLLRISLSRKISGDAVIDMEFSGAITGKLRGFYCSSYTYNGRTEHMLTTQFEAADARRAFPCFDEPELKATFDLSLQVDQDMQAVSNMPVRRERTTGTGKRIVEFATTPVMSTYLLYYGIGRFEFTKTKFGGRTFRVVTVAGKQKYAQLPLEYLKAFMKFFESYFKIRYPLPKVDMIAVPDFEAGAMENWGAITFRETDLLCDEKSSVAVKQRVATVIAHELSHQWFGDLVTMRWWDDLWLNEGFAAFMEVRAPDSVYPKWDMGLRGMTTRLSEAFGADQLNSTHPVSVKVRSPADIGAIFDNISYAKGSSVLTMLEDYIGAERFRKGLIRYLKKHAYSNAMRADLWNAIGAESAGGAKPFETIARSWIEKEGHPIVEARGPDKKGIVRLKQSRFTLLGARNSTVWPIPIHYATNSEKGMLLMRSRSAKLHVKPGTEYIKLNYMQKGFYRVRYDKDNLSALGRHIRDGIMGHVDGWGVEMDLYSLARSNRIRVEDYLDFVSEYCMDCGYPMNSSVSTHLSMMNLLFHGTKKAAKVRETSMRFHRAMLKRLGWNRRREENQTTTLLRGTAIMRLGMCGDKSTTDKANALFASYIKSGASIDPNIRGAVYAIAASTGDESTLRKIKGLYLKEQMPDEKRRLLQAMGFFRERRLILAGLEFSMGSDVRSQDDQFVMAMASTNPYASKTVLKWLEAAWPSILERHSEDGLLIGRYVESLSTLAGNAERNEIRRFFVSKRNYTPRIARSLDKTLELIEINKRFLKINGCSDERP